MAHQIRNLDLHNAHKYMERTNYLSIWHIGSWQFTKVWLVRKKGSCACVMSDCHLFGSPGSSYANPTWRG